MRKIQFGAGSLHLPGPWENYDSDVDCSKPLDRGRFPNRCAAVVFSEMMVEHLKPAEAFAFLEECYRILMIGGLIRITIPDFVRCWKLKDPDWLRVNQQVTQNDGSMKEQMKSIVVCHGHQSMWTSELLQAVLESIGFKNVKIQCAGQSYWEELRGIEQHHKSVGVDVALAESGCVEGIKM